MCINQVYKYFCKISTDSHQYYVLHQKQQQTSWTVPWRPVLQFSDQEDNSSYIQLHEPALSENTQSIIKAETSNAQHHDFLIITCRHTHPTCCKCNKHTHTT